MACAKHIVKSAKAARTEPVAPARGQRWKKVAKLAAGAAGLGLGAYGAYRLVKRDRRFYENTSKKWEDTLHDLENMAQQIHDLNERLGRIRGQS